MKPTLQLLTTACLALTLSACGGGGGATSDTPASSGATAQAPATVSGATVQASSDTTITLNWQAVAGASYYEVWRNNINPQDPAAFQLVSRPNSNSYQDSNLVPGTDYAYRLHACASTGCSKPSELTGKTKAKGVTVATPAVPRATKIETTQISLEWTAVDGASSYKLERNGQLIANGADIRQVTYLDSGLTAASNYSYRLQACNTNTCSDWSTALSVQTLAEVVTPPKPPVAPAVPTAPSVVVNNSSSLTVSWSAVSGANRYVLKRNGVQVGGDKLSALSFPDAGLIPGTAYSYQLQACADSLCSDNSPATTASTRASYKITLSTSGFDNSSGSNLSLVVDGYDDTGWVRGAETISGNGSGTSFIPVLNGEKYGATISAQPASGQSCSASPTGRTSIANSDVTISINCLTPAVLNFAEASKSVVSGVAGTAIQAATAKTLSGSTLNTFAIRYSSSNPAVATVDAVSGNISALNTGTTTITAGLPADLYTATSASYTLTVTPVVAKTRLATMELAQVLAQRPGSKYQTLIPNRDLLVRAYLYARSADAVTPATNVKIGGEQFAMTCPAKLPADDSSNAISYTLNQHCYTTIPGRLIKSGAAMDIVTSDGQSLSANLVVNDANTIRITMVPLIINGQTAQIPTAEVLTSVVKRLMPFANVVVTVHAPWAPAGTFDDSLSGKDQMGQVLSLLDKLRVSEKSSDHYYGMVPWMKWSGTTGIGYVSYLTAIGRDLRSGADATDETMIHEVGHNLSLSHAPCGGPSGPDPYFSTDPLPWPNSDKAQLSEVPLYNQGAGILSSPGVLGSRSPDLMSYCGGKLWFSEYSFNKMSGHIRGKADYKAVAGNQVAANQIAANPAAAQNMMMISGDLNGGTFNPSPVQFLGSGYTANTEGGEYQLKIVSSDGKTTLRRFTPLQLDHAGSMHVSVVLPSIAGIVSIDVLKQGQLLPKAGVLNAAAAQPKAATGLKLSADAAPVTAQALTTNLTASSLRIRWNHLQQPWLSVIHIAANGKRTALALSVTDGDQRLSLQQLPAGGSLQISLSDGLNSSVITLKR
ncbi:fibronectin type III domain-containing protein [Undibacterium sp. CY7W]|uniref:Fibronectin type III domain-containing protein n=3 Tax=Undibacterium TaxID=401469 RepID=A0A923I0U6_9BURK|nr:fibronectin type III domain-containing protein [Undibacterium rugosum]MBC3935723.1 fibronectin type III domain-containing protein [Undibacterium rugosum]